MASISIPEKTEARIKDRSGADQTFSGQINDDLTLAWALLDRGMISVRKKFTRTDIMVILDVQNGAFLDASQLSMWIHGGLLHQVADGLALDQLDQKWKISGAELLKKVTDLNDLETVSVLDWCRWMWRHNDIDGHWEKELAMFAG